MKKSNRKRTLTILCAALVLIVLGSALAGMYNGSRGAVEVSRFSVKTDNGVLSGLLYKPKTATAETPRPAVVVTHGYLNSAEMQDANAIELSRRGYVVFAMDQYDHGHSAFDKTKYGGTDFFSLWSKFWINSQYDAVQYAYDQPYVLKDEAGNGIIGVTGHSMGGFGSALAVYFDEMSYAETGIRKIYAALTEGADYSYTGFVGVTVDVADQTAGGRVLGKVAAQFDEFFFNDPDAPAGTVRKKNYVGTPEGQAFLQQTAPAAGTWYDTSDGGRRIIYQPYETHPWNHFSKVTTASAVEFYTEAFKDFDTGVSAIAANDQIWLWKEIFECVALAGFVLMLVPVAEFVMELPFFRNARTGSLKVLPAAKGNKKAILAVILVIAILLPGLFFSALYDGAEPGKTILFWCAIAVGVIGLVLGILGRDRKGSLAAGIIAAVAGAALAVVCKSSLYSNNAVWVAPVVNSIAYWTLACALIALLIMAVVFVLFKGKDGATLAEYGVVLKPMAIIAGLCTAVVTVAAAYAVLFLIDALFKTDFRIWTFAFKTFDMNIIPAVLKYLPTFILFYLISTASITINAGTKDGVKGYLLAICLNAGGIILWLLRQYITLFATGVAAHPGSALSGIVLVAMVPTLAIAACISRALAKRTGNIWTGAFLNAILMTIMTVANTTVYFK